MFKVTICSNINCDSSFEGTRFVVAEVRGWRKALPSATVDDLLRRVELDVQGDPSFEGTRFVVVYASSDHFFT